jgi:NAD(P)-dependent dehydrogenase (short-subunit alcohol dehydrogenase family)
MLETIITGSTGALGKVVTMAFLKSGHRVYSLVRDQNRAESDWPSGEHRPVFIECDLTDSTAVDRAAQEIMQKTSSLDALVMLAGGFSGGKSISQTGSDVWHKMLNLNLTTVFNCAHSIMPIMEKQNHGKIVTVSAMAGINLGRNKGAYSVSKAGVMALTKILAEEGKKHHIQANSIAPSIIKTAANTESMPDADQGRWVEPEKIAELILYLCSPAADRVTGNIIAMTGD